MLDKISESYDKLVEFTDEQRQINAQQVQINGRLERLLAEVIRQRRNGNPNGGSHAHATGRF